MTSAPIDLMLKYLNNAPMSAQEKEALLFALHSESMSRGGLATQAMLRLEMKDLMRRLDEKPVKKAKAVGE